MSQEYNKKIKLEKGETYFNAAARIGDYLYYSAKYMNGLFRADLQIGKSEFITVFDTDRETDIHHFAFSVRNEVWFIPNCLPDRIAIFNVDSLELEYMDIPEPKKARNGFLFMNPIVKGELVWLVPGVYDALLCLDTRNRTTKKIDLPIDDYEDYIITQGCEYDEKIYLCPWGCNKFLYLDLASEEIQALDDVEIEKNMYRNIIIVDNHIYLLPQENPNDILEIDLRDRICRYRSFGSGDTETYTVAAYYDNSRKQITIFPSLKESCIYIYHMDNCETEQIEMECDIDPALYGEAFWRDIVKISEDTFLVIATDRSVPILECHNQEFKTFLLEEPEDLLARRLLSLIERKEQKREQMKEQGKIGEKIYQTITSDVP